MTLITDALGMTTTFGNSLKGATEKLSAAYDREQVKAVIEALMKSTRDIQETNKALEDRLAAPTRSTWPRRGRPETINSISLLFLAAFTILRT